jgi:hypothetical protein
VSGSGRVAVVSLERGDQGGSNGTGWRVVVAILSVICIFNKEHKNC